MNLKPALAALAALAVVAAPGLAAAKDAPANTPASYVVVRENASVPFANRVITGYRVGPDRTVIFEGPGRALYRATLWEPCANELRFRDHIGFSARGTDTLDRFSMVYVNGNRCPIRTLDRVERAGS